MPPSLHFAETLDHSKGYWKQFGGNHVFFLEIIKL